MGLTRCYKTKGFLKIYTLYLQFFYRAASMQGGLSHERNVRPSVCLSVRPSVCQTLNCADILIPHKRSFILVFCQEEWLVEDSPFYLKSWVKLTRLERNAEFQSIFGRSSSAVTPSQKVQLTLIGSILRAFQ